MRSSADDEVAPSRTERVDRRDDAAQFGQAPQAPGHRTLVTHIFVRGDAFVDSDAVFGVKDSLIRDFHRQAPRTPTPDGRVIEGTWSRTVFDVVLAPEGP